MFKARSPTNNGLHRWTAHTNQAGSKQPPAAPGQDENIMPDALRGMLTIDSVLTSHQIFTINMGHQPSSTPHRANGQHRSSQIPGHAQTMIRSSFTDTQHEGPPECQHTAIDMCRLLSLPTSKACTSHT